MRFILTRHLDILLQIPTMVTQSGIVASQGFQVVQKEIPGAPPWFRMPEVADALFLDAVVNPGNGGGPAYLPSSGEVILCVYLRRYLRGGVSGTW